VNRYEGVLPWSNTSHSVKLTTHLQSSAEVKNAGSLPPLPHAVHRDNFTLPYCGLEIRHRKVSILRPALSAMPWLRQLLSRVSLQRPGFDQRPVHVGFMDQVALTHVSLQVLQFSAVGINPKFNMLITHSSTTDAT
jgi:hypothetical protein